MPDRQWDRAEKENDRRKMVVEERGGERGVDKGLTGT